MKKRSYQQNCALARANDIIGERWTLLLLRDLLVFPRRFNELLASAKGMGSNLLAARLKHLEAAGIVERARDAGGLQRYAITDRGRALEPAILALIRWGLNYGPANQADDHHHADDDNQQSVPEGKVGNFYKHPLFSRLMRVAMAKRSLLHF